MEQSMPAKDILPTPRLWPKDNLQSFGASIADLIGLRTQTDADTQNRDILRGIDGWGGQVVYEDPDRSELGEVTVYDNGRWAIGWTTLFYPPNPWALSIYLGLYLLHCLPAHIANPEATILIPKLVPNSLYMEAVHFALGMMVPGYALDVLQKKHYGVSELAVLFNVPEYAIENHCHYSRN